MKVPRQLLSFLLGTSLTLLFVVIVTETVLQIYSRRSRPEIEASMRGGNANEVSGRKSLRVLVIGESTTAPAGFDGVDRSWPAQAETLLRNALVDTRVSVTNIAQPGSSTAFQAEELMRRFDEIRPDILVSMMGINDKVALGLRESAWWNSLRILHFFRWLYEYGTCVECFQLSGKGAPATYREPPGFLKAFFDGFSKWRTFNEKRFERTAAEFEFELRKLQDQPHERMKVLSNFASMLGWLAVRDHEHSEQIRSVARSYFKRALLIDPIDSWSLENFCSIQLSTDETCVRSVEKMITAGVVPNDAILRSLIQFGGERSPIIRREIDRRGLSVLAGSTSYEATKSNYRKVATFAKENHLLYFAMQYPTGSIDGIRVLFTDSSKEKFNSFSDAFYMKGLDRKVAQRFDHVIFVENTVFNEPEIKADGAKYFVDMFGRDSGLEFGHTTAEGHRLIAENVVRAIKAELDRRNRANE